MEIKYKVYTALHIVNSEDGIWAKEHFNVQGLLPSNPEYLGASCIMKQKNKDNWFMKIMLDRKVGFEGDSIGADFLVDNSKGDYKINDVKWKLVMYIDCWSRNKKCKYSLRKRITKVHMGPLEAGKTFH